MLPLGDHETRPAQPIAAVEIAPIDCQTDVRVRSSPQPRPAWRVELLDNRLHVPRGLAGRNVSPHRGHGHDVQLRVRQGQTQRHGVVDARVDVEDHLPGHCVLVS